MYEDIGAFLPSRHFRVVHIGHQFNKTVPSNITQLINVHELQQGRCFYHCLNSHKVILSGISYKMSESCINICSFPLIKNGYSIDYKPN
jgi:hypothetical protein